MIVMLTLGNYFKYILQTSTGKGGGYSVTKSNFFSRLTLIINLYSLNNKTLII